SIGMDVGREVQLDAIRPELNGHRGKPAAGALNHRIRELPTRQELRWPPAYRREVGFRQHLEDAFILQRAHRKTDVQVGVEVEDVQRVLNQVLGRSWTNLGKSRRGVSAGCNRPCILPPTEKIDPKLVELGAVHLGNTHLQLHLRDVPRIDHQRVHDFLRIGGRQSDRLVRGSLATYYS